MSCRSLLKWMPIELAGKLMGWNLIIKARKPRRSAAIRARYARSGDAGEALRPARPFERALAAGQTDFAAWLEKRRGEKRLYIEEAPAASGRRAPSAIRRRGERHGGGSRILPRAPLRSARQRPVHPGRP